MRGLFWLSQPVLLYCLVLSTSLVAGDRRRDPQRLSIATFNARFLFDGVEPEGEVGFPWKNDAVLARRHLQDIARILRPVDADILHLSEVEDLATIERLALELGDATYRAYLVPGRDDFTRQNVGLLTRIDLITPMTRTDEWAPPPGGGRHQGVPKNYAARIDVGPLRLTFVGAHLLAFPDDPERWPRREAQAEVLRRFAVEEGTQQGRLTVILGDLNDHDPTLADAAGQTARSQTLSILSTVDPRQVSDDLWNPIAHLEPSQRFTAYYDRNQDGIDDGLAERSLTDHILLPAALRHTVERVEVFASHDPRGASDHFPLQVTLDITRARPFLRGDVTGNGRLETSDIFRLLALLFLGEPVDCDDAADANDDGRLQLTDAVVLVHHLFRQAPPLPGPGPESPGMDGTDDGLDCR